MRPPVETWYLDENGEPVRTETGDFRVHLYVDEDAGPLDDQGDFLPFVAQVESSWAHHRGYAAAGNQWSDGIDAADISRAWAYYRDAEKVERWLRICHGVVGIETWSDRYGNWWFAIATDKWVRESVGDPERVAEVLAHTAQFVQDWAEGNVYGWEVERKQTGSIRKTFDNPARGTYLDRFEEWEEVDSCWGYVGDEWAKENALEALRTEA